ncbi:MAG: hypothetical protein ACO2OR_01810 [Desulfurococcaceae archaeon]
MSTIEAARAVLYTELARPPLVSELARLVVEKSPPSRVSLSTSGVLQAKLETSRSLEELEGVLSELFTRDIATVLDYLHRELGCLPGEHAEYFRVLLEASELELLYSKLASRSPEEKPLKYTRVEDCSECASRAGFDCVVLRYIARLREKCLETREDCERALIVAALLGTLYYTRYLANLRRLGLGEGASLKQLVSSITERFAPHGLVYFEPSLARVLGASERGGDSVEAWCSGVLALYEEAKSLLYYTNKLVDLLTLYGVDRLLRYRLLRALYSRWLRPW